MKKALKAAICAVAIAAAPSISHAAVITSGFTFAVADGNHFHSSTGGDFGNPSGKAEVGRFSTEIVKGLSEYNLTGLSLSPSAFVTFNVFKAGGLFNGTNSTPFTGNISVIAYQGNNLENLSDFSAASAGLVGSFAVAPGTTNVGDIFSFDITSIYNQAITNGWSSLGIRLEQSPVLAASQAWTFDSFRLTSDNLSTNGAVPEPATWLMMLLGFAAIGTAMRHGKRQQAALYA